MPQMAPMNWILMSSSFIIILWILSKDLPNIIKEQIKWKW